MQQIRKKRAKWTHNDGLESAGSPEVHFLHFLNFSCVLHNMPLERNVSVIDDVTYHTLIQVADEHRSHYDKTVKSFGYLLMHENAPKQITNCT